MLEDCGERVEVVGSAFFDQDVSDAAEQAGVHIVLVDIELMGQEQLRGPLERLLQSASSFRTAIYTDRQEGRYLFEALRLGAAGYLLKSTPAQMLVNQLERIRAGEVVILPPWLPVPPWPRPGSATVRAGRAPRPALPNGRARSWPCWSRDRPTGASPRACS